MDLVVLSDVQTKVQDFLKQNEDLIAKMEIALKLIFSFTPGRGYFTSFWALKEFAKFIMKFMDLLHDGNVSDKEVVPMTHTLISFLGLADVMMTNKLLGSKMKQLAPVIRLCKALLGVSLILDLQYGITWPVVLQSTVARKTTTNLFHRFIW